MSPPFEEELCPVASRCNSTATKRGLNSVSTVQARLAVDYAARIHQSQIPGSDGISRPRICIITPYSAQVDEIKARLREASDKELCRDLIEVRTQAAATGGEWDVVILCVVRDEKMGFLSETNRINVMLTRSKFLSIDIFAAEFLERPRGHRSKVIRHYKDYQARNGAVCRDRRNWGNVCRRCCKPHDKDCRDEPRCFFCYEGHHVRNCRDTGSLQSTINPDVMNVPPLTPDRPDVPEADRADFIDAAIHNQPEDNQPEEVIQGAGAPQTRKPAKALYPDVKFMLDAYLEDDSQPLVIDAPMPSIPGYDEDGDEEDEEEEQDQEQDDGRL
ncbi:hypothetical protein INS49_002420 [Diaporthe citri]|uniref:uncharacterized protein n=1 Tax=Diaporthe citri TaxID=83186 RepID=UPI001C82127E|nr:uncharacterized protein INS49_002420 [Diaporthe citri]KAG6368219.1 hypothetical protein INS49_002420 [Diaporthe citri]